MKKLLFLLVLIVTVFLTYTVIAQELGSARGRYEPTIPQIIQKLVLDPIPARTYSVGADESSALLDTLYVPTDYATIQSAINAAADGNLVLVDEGTYVENINFKGKAITVASNYLIDENEMHIENTVIDGSQPSNPDSGSVVTLNSGEDTTSVICGFKITGGSGTLLNVEGARRGGGILTYNSGVKIINDIIENNTINFTSDASGAGISVNTDPPYTRNFVIENNIIRNNTITTPTVALYSTGGGIHSWNVGGYVRISNNKVLNNTITAPSAYGGGIVPAGLNNNNYFVLNNLVSGNILNAASGGSGGIDVYNHNPVIKNNLIIFNSAPNGGGLLIETASPVFINNTVAFNTATSSGGGINIIGVTPSLMNCIFWGNNAPVGSQINGSGDVQYSDIEGGFTGTGNINQDPEFDPTSEFYELLISSPCIDLGNPDVQYNDVEDPQNPGNPLWPAQGSLRNDMGHFGGPASLWGFWNWPVPVELASFTATLNGSEVILNWSTATELNNLGFEIQRSTEGKEFFTVGFVNGHGTTTEQQNYSYADRDLDNGKYYYKLKQVDFNGTYEYSDVVEVDYKGFNSYLLEQNYPNPFNPTTTIGFGIKNKSNVKITILNAIGEEVAVVLNEEKEPGYHTVEFNAANLPSGVYFYQLRASDFVQTKKMLLLK